MVWGFPSGVVFGDGCLLGEEWYAVRRGCFHILLAALVQLCLGQVSACLLKSLGGRTRIVHFLSPLFFGAISYGSDGGYVEYVLSSDSFELGSEEARGAG